MKHSFQPLIGQRVCAVCHRAILDHLKTAICECCSNIGSCELIGNILMCASCETKHNETNVVVSTPDKTLTPLEHVVSQVNRVPVREDIIKGSIGKYTDFFNAKIVAITELEQQILNDESLGTKDERHYRLAKALYGRITYLTQVLFDTRSLEIELSAEVKGIQQYCNQLIPKLREDARKEFAANNIDYQPATAIAKAPKIRMSTEDRLAENYAKMMKMDLPTAKKLLANKLRSECTCAVTPGICKVHK